MTKDLSMLSSTTPTTVAPAAINISHVQLRDLVICPRERGLVNYVTQSAIVEQDLTAPGSTPRRIVDLPFTPNTLASLHVPGTDHTLLAAGGQEAELYLSLHHHSTHQRRTGALMWRFEDHLHASINNSVMLTSLNLTRSNESSIEPRVAISNNDCTVKFFDVPIAVRGSPRIKDAGSVRLNVPVNHSSISPDGSTLLSVGDSSKVFLHRISGGSRLSFSPIATLSVPPPDRSLLSLPSTSLAASFSTAFSRDGSKYAVASQEGVVCVWDVRSTKPLKIFQTDKSRLPSGSDGWLNPGTGMASGWLSDDPYEWTRGNSKAPGWSVRNVKFGSGGGNSHGKEIMTFTEHTSLLHVVDGRTFETEEIVRVPPAPKNSAFAPTSRTQPRRRTVAGSSVRTSQTRMRSHVRPYQRPASSARALAASIVNPNPSRHVPSHLLTSRRDREAPQAPYVLLALEDTFRIPVRLTESGNGTATAAGSSTSSSTGWRSRQRERDADLEDLVVIPPLGDREVEDDVQALLGSHGLRARRVGSVSVGVGARGDLAQDEDDPDSPSYDERDQEDARMEVDELETQEPETEWDCVSSHAPSRSSSPGLGPGASAAAGPGGNAGTNRWRMWPRVETLRGVTDADVGMDEEEDVVAAGQFDYEDSEEPESLSGRSSRAGLGAHGKDQDLDIAGTCFDPSGGYIYVATTDSVAEWNVKGSEKRWWTDSGNDWC